MNEPKTLQEHLTFYRQQHRRQKLYSGLAICWGLCALAVVALLLLGQTPAVAWPVVAVAAAGLATLVLIKVWIVGEQVEQLRAAINEATSGQETLTGIWAQSTVARSSCDSAEQVPEQHPR